MDADFTIQNEGSVFLVRPLNTAAAEHIEERASEEAQWFGGALAVEHKYVAELAERLQEEGFTLS